MESRETFPINNTENDPAAEGKNPWQKMTEEAPPFGGGEKYSASQSELEWLSGLVKNASARLEEEQDSIIREEDVYYMDEKEREAYLKHNEVYQDNKRSLEFKRRQSEILENLDVNGDGGVLGALERKRNSFAEIMNSSEVSKETQESAIQDWDAATNLYSILSEEMARRNPEYFGQEEISMALKSEVARAKRRVEQTMVDGYFGEDGFLHKTQGGEKMPSVATEDAEIDLKYAEQDVETFDSLMNDYQAANNYAAPRAIKKEDFAPIINQFVSNHTIQISQLIAESKTLAKGTPEYIENEAKRKKLAQERSSAKRLTARYFNTKKHL